jgi:DNA (cytosine-5)-methyltransferase 3A
MNIISLFDGIAVTRQALKDLNLPVNTYVASEIDPYADYIAQNNHKDIINLGDVLDICGDDFDEQFDLLIGGSPCQGFSLQGLQLGMSDPRSGLIQHYFRLLEELKPKYFLLENVRMKPECKDYISSVLGVQPIELNSSLVVPQSRNRLYWTNIPIGTLEQQSYNPLDILTTPGTPGTTRKGPPRVVVPTDMFGCLTASYYKGIRADGRPLVATEFGEFDLIREFLRMLTPVECERLQGLPDNYTEGVSNTQRYKALGNAFTLPIIKHLLSNLKNHLPNS